MPRKYADIRRRLRSTAADTNWLGTIDGLTRTSIEFKVSALKETDDLWDAALTIGAEMLWLGDDPRALIGAIVQQICRHFGWTTGHLAIKWFCDLKDAKRVVLWLRVSEREQERTKNLEDQEANLRQAVAWYGVPIIEVFRHVGSGQEFDDHLLAAMAYALEHDAVLLAESVDRFVRHPDYHSIQNPDAQAGEDDLNKLARLANGATLMTHLWPDASPFDVRSYQRKRGQKHKDRPGGGDRRPGYKKRQRERLLATVRELRAAGWSYRKIAQEVGCPVMTLCDWTKRA